MTDSPGGAIRVLAFTSEGVFNSVLDSQMVVPLGLLGRRAPHVQRALLVLTSSRHRGDPRVDERARVIRDALPRVPAVFRYRPVLGLPLETRRWAGHLRRGLLECGYTGDAPIIVHCRGEGPAAAAVVLKRRDPRLRVLLDLRGAATDEVAGRGLRSRYVRRRVRRALEVALAGADAINTVSQRLADHLRETGLLTRPIPSSVVGCCADTTRFYFDPQVRAARRQGLGLADRFVVCYCGAMWRWQRPDAVAAAFAAIHRALPDAHMLIVSHQAELLVGHLQRAGVSTDSVTVRAARHDEVAPHLMAADVGLLLRENSLTNRVASPVKFAEYLRCGLPVILTPYVGDSSAFATTHGVGRIVDFPVRAEEIVEAARAVRGRLATEGDAYRALCSRIAGEQFSWDAQLAEIIRLYETLAR